MAVGTEPYIPGELPDWKVRQDVGVSRHAVDAPRALRERRHLAPVIHFSLGTVDDPERPRRFRRAVRRIMRIVGPDRCVVWTNIARPHRKTRRGTADYSLWGRLNKVLEDEAGRRDNLVIADWLSMAKAHPEWMSSFDGTHVSKKGYRARARLVARAVRACADPAQEAPVP